MPINQYAGYSRRLLAYLFDMILMWLVPLIILFAIVCLSQKSADTWIGSLWFFWELFFFQWLLGLIYKIVSYSLFSASFGKLLAGIQIDKEDGKRPTFQDGLIRFIIGYTVSGLGLGLGFFWIIKDPKKKGFHDHIAKTVVVTKGPLYPVLIGLPLIILTNLMLLYFSLTIGLQKGTWQNMGADLTRFGQVISDIYKRESLIAPFYQLPSPTLTPYPMRFSITPTPKPL